MEDIRCPRCDSTRVEEEKRRRDAKGRSSIGSWRIPYSVASGIVVFLFGIFCVFAARLATNPFLVELSVIGAAASFVFAAFVFGSVVYFGRWDEHLYYRCRACNALWERGDPAHLIDEKSPQSV